MKAIRDAVVRFCSDSGGLAPEARAFKTKAKNAQEAHEAIVVTDPSTGPVLDKRRVRPQRMLYELIWRRSLACQMQDAVFKRVPF